MQRQWRGSSDPEAPVAAVLPGSGYTALGPLLHWPIALLTEAGHRVAVVEWEAGETQQDPFVLCAAALGRGGRTRWISSSRSPSAPPGCRGLSSTVCRE